MICHELGLVHHDLSTAISWLIDDVDNLVIVDFDSCKREGEELGVQGGGTMGWVVGVSKYAVPEIDSRCAGEARCVFD
ncbi:hypothetical protein F4778DRAFT_743114 [Xylariomycetidae sp. FL2044]|nr:hypothetical protein F4778DRAFT_743114 [Xylariomycetidae sp. FL2044]